MSDPPNFENLHDDTLVQQVKESLGGKTAFAELYRRYVHRVYRYLLAQTGDEQDAQDLTAQTFLVALEAMPTFRGDSTFLTWLFGIARHRALEHFRKNKRLVSLEQAEDISEPEPEEAVTYRLQLEKVMQTFHILSEDRAEALALHSFGGLSIKEVALVMQRQEAAVRMLIHRAIKDLQQRLAFSPEEQSS